MKPQMLQIVAIIGAVIMVFLGFLIFQEYKKTSVSLDTTKPTVAVKPLPTRSPDELKILNAPLSTATTDQRMKHLELAKQLAKNTNTVDITACTPVPVVTRLLKGGSFIAKNTDKQQHTIVIDRDHIFSVPGNKSVTIKAEFGKGAGLYGYGCDDSRNAVGFFLLSE